MRRLALAALGLPGAAVLAGRRVRDLGTRGDEATTPMPGDQLVPTASLSSTMAMTIQAPPEAIFPWLVQMGCGRAGWYSLDRLDNSGVRSAERIEPRWQVLEAGDRMPARPNGRAWFDVALLDAPHLLVLRASLTVPGGRSYRPGVDRPRWYSDSTWAFALRSEAADSTRLLVRLRVGGAPRRAAALGNTLVLAPGHALMQRRQLTNLRRRVESAARGSSGAG